MQSPTDEVIGHLAAKPKFGRDTAEFACETNTARTRDGCGQCVELEGYRLGAADVVVGVAAALGVGLIGVGLWAGATSAAPPFWVNV